MGNYTSTMENFLWSSGDQYDNPEENYTEVIDYLNSEKFRSFGAGLLTFITPRLNENESPLECLKRCCKEQKIDMVQELGSINTIKRWFSGGERPKKGENSRQKMFVLAFVLTLSAKETKSLFTSVFLDRACNPRNPKELIYYYCLENHLSFNHAQNMCKKIYFIDGGAEDGTIFTSIIDRKSQEMKDDSALIEYINTHPHNFSINSRKAKETVAKYLDRAKKCVLEEIDRFSSSDDTAGKNINSVNFMYEKITGQCITSSRGTKTILKNAELPKEIRNSFPEAVTFSKKEPSYEELRKMIIFLFSYCYWVACQTGKEKDFVDFESEINTILFDAGLPMLYPGNPFDWMFCFCTLTEKPLDTFRGIIAEAIPECP